jgi:tRNA threonylcarbamoyladenosine biosynthesis protein TsaE
VPLACRVERFGSEHHVKDAPLLKQSQEGLSCTLDSISHSEAQTQRLGMRLGELLCGGELILLNGQLGTGKTTFTQGLARGMGINANINSPTFTLLKEYAGQLAAPPGNGRTPHRGPALYHFDLYRLDDPAEIFDLGFEEYFSTDGVCVVEWAEKADLYWPADHLDIRLKMLSDTKRGLFFAAVGPRYCELLRQFQKSAYVTTGS